MKEFIKNLMELENKNNSNNNELQKIEERIEFFNNLLNETDIEEEKKFYDNKIKQLKEEKKKVATNTNPLFMELEEIKKQNNTTISYKIDKETKEEFETILKELKQKTNIKQGELLGLFIKKFVKEYKELNKNIN